MTMRHLLHGGSSDSADTSQAPDTGALILKLVSMGIVSVVILIFAYIPFRLRKSPSLNQDRLLSYSNCVSGGIFLGFAFMHILPDAVNDFANYSDTLAPIPIIYFIVMLGFFSVLAVEKIIYTKVMKSDLESNYSFAVDAPQSVQLVAAASTSAMEGCSSGCNCDAMATKPDAAAAAPGIEVESQSPTPVAKALHDHEGHFHTHDVPFKTNKRTTPYIIAMSLCFHSIFEGLALGLQSTLASTALLLIGIAVHKTAEAFAMSVSFVRNDTPRKHWAPLLAVFTFVVPVGIAIGLGLSEVGELSDLFSSIMGAIAAGSFLYVALLGVIVEEFSHASRLWTKFLLVMGGLVFMAVLESVTGVYLGG